MSLVEGGGVVATTKPFGDVIESWDSSDENTEIGHSQSQEIDVHDTLEIGSGENHQIEEVADDTDTDDDVGHH